jgi:DNA polymerase-3 subunit alpha
MFEQAKATKRRFVEGSVENGVPRQIADDLYEKILFFAGYGFAKSHAVSYAMVSYYCAWLLTYYEEEWSCAYLDAMSGDIKKLRKAIGEVKAMGYTVVPIDVNYATRTWTILPGKRLMPSLNACKGVGASAAKEIMRNRPYASVEDFLWDDEGKWKHSKCNKSTFSALIRARAFDSLGAVDEGGTFNNYQQMHDVIINNWADLRKSLKTKPTYAQDKLKEAIEETQATLDFTPAQVAKNQTELFGAFDAADVVDPNLMKALAKSGIESIDEAAEQEDVHWFVISKAIPKLTKNGRPYLLLEGMGESGLNKRVYCWGWDGTTRLEEFSLVAAQVKKNDFGYATQFRKLRVM